jgi:hypothetical protein
MSALLAALQVSMELSGNPDSADLQKGVGATVRRISVRL